MVGTLINNSIVYSCLGDSNNHSPKAYVRAVQPWPGINCINMSLLTVRGRTQDNILLAAYFYRAKTRHGDNGGELVTGSGDWYKDVLDATGATSHGGGGGFTQIYFQAGSLVDVGSDMATCRCSPLTMVVVEELSDCEGSRSCQSCPEQHRGRNHSKMMFDLHSSNSQTRHCKSFCLSSVVKTFQFVTIP